MDRLPFRLYREGAYLELVSEFFDRVGFVEARRFSLSFARSSFRGGSASGRNPYVWAAAVIRVCVLEKQHGAVLSGKGPVMDVSQRDLAAFYGVTDVAIRNTAKVLRKEL